MSDLSYYLTPNTSMQAIPTVAVESAIARIEELEAALADSCDEWRGDRGWCAMSPRIEELETLLRHERAPMSESPNDDMRPKSPNDDVRDGWPARFRLFTLRRKAKR